MEYIELHNEYKLPKLCYGPGMITRGLKFNDNIWGKIKYKYNYKREEIKYFNAVLCAIKNGYRFIDYSSAYGREDLINKAIKVSGIKREDLILTTRVSNKAQFTGKIRDEFFGSLKKYGVDYIDVLMFHWPVTGHYLDTWNEMIKLKKEGYCKIIGVANCNEHHINNIISNSFESPSINQIEIHPLFTQKPLVKFCKGKKIQIEAYTPFARFDDRMTRLPLLKNMCIKYKRTLAQLILRWHIQNGIIPVFRSLNNKRLMENINIFDFKLSDEDIRAIDSININSRLRYDPDNCDFSIL